MGTSATAMDLPASVRRSAERGSMSIWRRLVSIAATAPIAAALPVPLAARAGAVSADFFIRDNGDGAANAANCPANAHAGSGSCRLRDAIAAATVNAGDDTLVADAGLGTVTLTAGLVYSDA